MFEYGTKILASNFRIFAFMITWTSHVFTAQKYTRILRAPYFRLYYNITDVMFEYCAKMPLNTPYFRTFACIITLICSFFKPLPQKNFSVTF